MSERCNEPHLKSLPLTFPPLVPRYRSIQTPAKQPQQSETSGGINTSDLSDCDVTCAGFNGLPDKTRSQRGMVRLFACLSRL